MKVLSTGKAVPIVVAALLITLSIAFFGAAPQPSTTASNPAVTDGTALPEPPPPTVSETIPPDVEIPAGFPATEIPIAYFDDLSWRTFLAANWPAVEGKRGVPDLDKKLGDKCKAVVWETWKAAYEVFQPHGERPSEWDSFEAGSPCKDIARADVGKAKVLVAFSNFGPVLEDFNQAGFGEVPVGPLVAQNRTYVRYEVRMNKVQYNFIRGDPSDPKTARYLRQNLPPADGAPLNFPFDSIEVKAAWREFRLPEEDLLDRYYHVEALLVDRQTRTYAKKTMGLVGLHIVHKTPSRPQWVWSTFEHVDNVAVGPGAPPKTRPTFNDPDGLQQGDSVNVLPPPINAVNPPQANPKPAQLVHWNPIDESTKKTNDLYHSHALVKDTVWKNYNLVATQWPKNPKAGGTGEPFPPNRVANVTMETEFQSISCMSCHGFTQRTDFVWALAVRAYPPTEQGVAPAVKALRENRKK
jgi:hypothetical protein